ncbi:MAG TPA: hypothetical protein VMT34_12275, partial [Aggregatilineales bacterium]|nr:hypothetical protein [Aggregatilineales bacterium]
PSLIDGQSETVQSIGLFESREDRSNYAPTVADLLAFFGPPQWVAVESFVSGGHRVLLKYSGLELVFFASADQVTFTENPLLYLGAPIVDPPSDAYRPWKGFNPIRLVR